MLGKSAFTQHQFFSGLSPAAQCCCGNGNLLWLHEIMGICFSQKSYKQNSGENKVQKQLILLRSSWHFPTYATIFCGISGFSDHKNYDIMFIIVKFFFRVASTKKGWLRFFERFLDIHKARKSFFRTVKTYRNDIYEKSIETYK